MTPSKGRRALPPLNQKQLEQLALRYVGRYATTRAKLRSYLTRKIRDRGWDDGREADLDALAERFSKLGYVDDAAFAMNKAQALAARGYGKRRLLAKLRIDGIDEDDIAEARRHADEEAVSAALRFARRRRLGPFATASLASPRERERAIAAMVRAGHGFDLARAIVDLAPGSEADFDQLQRRARLTND